MLGKKFVTEQRAKLSDPIERLNSAVFVLGGAIVGLIVMVSVLIVMVAQNAH